MKHTLYGLGGYDPDQPFDNRLSVRDDDARTYTDFRTGSEVTRPYTDEENAEADAQLEAQKL